MSSCRAYICYTRADEAAAGNLRRALTRFSPGVGPSSDPDQSATTTIGPILTKRLDAAPLGRATRFDIEASDHLILVCSPTALTKAMEEAAMIFKANGRGHRIIPVITAGEPGASRVSGLERLECLPRALRFAVDASGSLTDHAVTPRIVDLRPDGPGKDSAVADIATRLTGKPIAVFQKVAHDRRRKRAFLSGAVAAVALIALTIAPVLKKDMETAADITAAREAGLAAHLALDEGRPVEAARLLTKIFPQSFDFAAPPFSPPDEALSALSRTVLETRELSDIEAPVPDIQKLEILPQGTLAAFSAHNQTHLIDIGAATAVQVLAPDAAAISRLSPDGRTLWTARYGAAAHNEDGDEYIPLIFEDVDLASGAIVLNTAVQSLPPNGDGSAISPDGARVALDIGPGHTDTTLVAIFDRTEQVLDGVATLPADRAKVAFLTPERVLLTTNPPNLFGKAPGLYLWNLSEEAPRMLRKPDIAPVCPGAGGAPHRAIAAEIAAGRMPAADWAVSEDGAEITLLLPSLSGGSCLQRWDVATGRRKPTINTRTRFTSLTFTVADGPYAMRPEAGDLTLLSKAGEISLRGCAGAAHHFPDGGDPLILCEGKDATTLHHGYSGQRIWRGPALPPLTAVSHDPLTQRLIMARADGRITTWDSAERGYQIARTTTAVTLAQADDNHIAVLTDGAAPRFFDPIGRLTNAADPTLIARVQPNDGPELLILSATGVAAKGEPCEALSAPDTIHSSDSPSGRRAVVETIEGITVYDKATCLPLIRMDARTIGSGPLLVSDELLWAPFPGEISVFPLTIPPAEALAGLHARFGG